MEKVSASFGTLNFTASDQKLVDGFVWAKAQALAYAHHGGDPVGLWYEAALPGRQAFCMRDVSHQTDGADALGLTEHTKNMLMKFAENTAASRDYCSYWEITKDGLPCPDDYVDDSDFWLNHPGSFELIRAMWRQYCWTGDREYLENPVFLDYVRTVLGPYLSLWDKDKDGIIEHDPAQGRRGISSYNETDISVLAGGDMIASEYAAFAAAERMFTAAGFMEEAAEAAKKKDLLQEKYRKEWYSPEKQCFASRLLKDGGFDYTYQLESSFLPLFFGILDGDARMQTVAKDMEGHGAFNVEGQSYMTGILYHCGLDAEGYTWLLSLAKPDLSRREYPEVSYAYLGALVKGLCGIEAHEDCLFITPHLPQGLKAEITGLRVKKTELSVSFDGQERLEIRNTGDESIQIAAGFCAKDGEDMSSSNEQGRSTVVDAAGRTIRLKEQELKPGMSMLVCRM